MTSTPTEERVQRAARKLEQMLDERSLSTMSIDIARAILEAADAPETQKVDIPVTREMENHGLTAYWHDTIAFKSVSDGWNDKARNQVARVYRAMRPLEPEPVVTQEVAMAMYTAYENTLGRLDHIPCAQAVLSAAHRVLRGK